jgi:hypothetical protein
MHGAKQGLSLPGGVREGDQGIDRSREERSGSVLSILRARLAIAPVSTVASRRMRTPLVRIATFAAAAAASLLTSTALADGPKEHGGWGEAFIAPTLGKVAGLDGALQSPTLLGDSFKTGAYSTQIGGGGAFLLTRNWLVKMIGFGIIGTTAQTGNGSGRVLAGGGTLQLGYTVMNDDSWLAWPYIGLGGMGMSPQIENHTGKPMALGSSVIPPGGSAEAGIGLFTGEIGFSLRRLMLFGEGGFVVGAELGGLFTLAHGSWTDQQGISIPNLGSGRFDGAYLRISIGGGTFVEAKKLERARRPLRVDVQANRGPHGQLHDAIAAAREQRRYREEVEADPDPEEDLSDRLCGVIAVRASPDAREDRARQHERERREKDRRDRDPAIRLAVLTDLDDVAPRRLERVRHDEIAPARRHGGEDVAAPLAPEGRAAVVGERRRRRAARLADLLQRHLGERDLSVRAQELLMLSVRECDLGVDGQIDRAVRRTRGAE